MKLSFTLPLNQSCSPRGAPLLEVLQYQVDAWSGRSKLLFQLLIPKIHLIYCPRIEDVSDIKLIRTDTTLDLSQKAEKRYHTPNTRPCPAPAGHTNVLVTVRDPDSRFSPRFLPLPVCVRVLGASHALSNPQLQLRIPRPRRSRHSRAHTHAASDLHVPPPLEGRGGRALSFFLLLRRRAVRVPNHSTRNGGRRGGPTLVGS